jgi:hypothetical protein
MKQFKDFYGCHAYIKDLLTGGVRLTVYTPGGRLFHAKNYSTERGAKIAMGRMSDGWNEIKN